MHFLLWMSPCHSAFMKRAHLHSFQITQQEPGWPGYSVPPGLKDTWYRDVFIFLVPTWYRSTGSFDNTSFYIKLLYIIWYVQQAIFYIGAMWLHVWHLMYTKPWIHNEDLRGHLVHNLGRGVFDGVFQVVLDVAEELSSTSFNHIQKSPSIVSIHIWRRRAFKWSEFHILQHTWRRNTTNTHLICDD